MEIKVDFLAKSLFVFFIFLVLNIKKNQKTTTERTI